MTFLRVHQRPLPARARRARLTHVHLSLVSSVPATPVQLHRNLQTRIQVHEDALVVKVLLREKRARDNAQLVA